MPENAPILALDVRDVWKAFERTLALSGVSFGLCCQGAHDTGVALAAALKEHHWDTGPVGLVTISLARNNGKARTKDFREAMHENGDIKEVALDQMQRYSADETFKYVQDMLTAHPNLHGIFVQTDTLTLGAVRAIQAAHREILGPARSLRWGARIHRSDPPGQDRRLGNAATVPHGRAVRAGDVRPSRGQDAA